MLAHRDLAAESNKMIEDAVGTLKPLVANRPVIEKFFFDHGDFGQAIAEALHRNAENLAAAGQKMPPGLDWMRTPAGLLRIKGTK